MDLYSKCEAIVEPFFEKAVEISLQRKTDYLTFEEDGIMKSILLITIHRIFDKAERTTEEALDEDKKQPSLEQKCRTVRDKIVYILVGLTPPSAPMPIMDVHKEGVIDVYFSNLFGIDTKNKTPWQVCAVTVSMIFDDLFNLAESDKSVEECRKLFEETIDFFSDIFVGKTPENFYDYAKRRLNAKHPRYCESLRRCSEPVR